MASWLTTCVEDLKRSFLDPQLCIGGRVFVYLATSLRSHVNDLSNLNNQSSLRLNEAPPKLDQVSIAIWISQLDSSAQPARLAKRLVRFIKQLDQRIGASGEFAPLGPYPGKDGNGYTIVPRCSVLGERFGLTNAVGPADQAADLEWLIQHCAILDTRKFVVKRLPLHLSSQLNPLSCHLRAVTGLLPFENQLSTTATGIVMGDPSNDKPIGIELIEVVKQAERHEVDVLVLPELTVSADNFALIQQHLANSTSRFPTLLALGRTHHPSDMPGLCYNQAVLLGGDGEVLFAVDKRSAVAVPGKADDPNDRQYIREATKIAADDEPLPLLATPIGLIAVVTCLDLFHERGFQQLMSSHASLVLVPSLSPKTKPHQEAAARLARSRWAVTVMANRPLDATDPGRKAAPSFIQHVTVLTPLDAPHDVVSVRTD